MSGPTVESGPVELEKQRGERRSCLQCLKGFFSLVPKDATPPNWGFLWLVFVSLVGVLLPVYNFSTGSTFSLFIIVDVHIIKFIE